MDTKLWTLIVLVTLNCWGQFWSSISFVCFTYWGLPPLPTPYSPYTEIYDLSTTPSILNYPIDVLIWHICDIWRVPWVRWAFVVAAGVGYVIIDCSLQGAKVSAEAGLTTSQLGQRASMLMIERVGHRHSGTYRCKVSNMAGSVSSTTELKVNG